MKLLICAQAVDSKDPTLSFFIPWIEELAPRFESILVLCLREGEHKLPPNVRVINLGTSKVGRLVALVRCAWKFRGAYDAIFVHQGQEFILGAGWLWSLLSKPIYLWRNHYRGSWLTSVAASLCTKVFYTSDSSYTAHYGNAVKMPVGVDLRAFASLSTPRVPRSILSLGRISPSKRLNLLVDALKDINRKGVEFTASIYGPTLPRDAGYLSSLTRAAGALVRFGGGVPSSKTPALYAAHEIFVNISPGGMYDKTVFEAAAAGCLVLTSMDDFAEDAGKEFWFRPEELAQKLEEILALSEEEKSRRREVLHAVAQAHSLEALMKQLSGILLTV